MCPPGELFVSGGLEFDDFALITKNRPVTTGSSPITPTGWQSEIKSCCFVQQKHEHLYCVGCLYELRLNELQKLCRR